MKTISNHTEREFYEQIELFLTHLRRFIAIGLLIGQISDDCPASVCPTPSHREITHSSFSIHWPLNTTEQSLKSIIKRHTPFSTYY